MIRTLHLLPPAVGSPLGEPGYDPVAWGLALILCLALLVVLADR
jgi:hypothetical protein